MNIGTGTKNEAGHLEFNAVSLPFLRAEKFVLVKLEKTKDRSPDYAVHLGSAEGQRIGAVWKETPRGGGDPYLAGHVESPAFATGRLRFAIFSAKDDSRKGQLDMVWNADRDQPAARPAAAAADSAPTADPDGDEIPF
jgi:uncharacterized protein (DUF736 family)